MRNPYPTTPYRLPSPAMHANPSPQIGKRISLIALQEELQLPTGHGLVGTRRLKIMRIEQSAVLPDPLTLPRSPLREPVPSFCTTRRRATPRAAAAPAGAAGVGGLA